MFSKLLLASTAIVSTEAMHLKLHNKKVQETCDYNIHRITSESGSGDFSKFKNGGTPYKDPDFPADESSLFWRGNLYDSEMPQVYIDEVTGWARPSELTTNPSLWGSKGVKPAGTNQGRLGSCWFLASASALAENPDRIKKIFSNASYDSAGIFQFEFFHMTNPVKVTIDDRLPISEGKDPRYTSFGVKTPENSRESNNGAWWQPLLEKAYAKFNVNFGQLNGGQPGVALRELTGMPVQNYDCTKQTEEQFYATVTEADKNNWAIVAACMRPHASLVTGHAYTVLGTVKLNNGPQLVKVRNPWGKETYNGPFSDDDSQWTDAWKAQVGFVAANDGIFYLPVADFKKAFADYAILMYQDWHTDKKVVKGAGKTFGPFSFSSPTAQNIVMTVDYQNKRQTPKGCPVDDVFYNIYIDGGDPVSISTQTAYGSQRMEVKAGKQHNVEIYNWANASVSGNYVITLYGDSGPVTWS